MAKDYAKDFYNSTYWKKLRNEVYKEKFGLCEKCGKPGRIVHHKIKLTAENINNPNITLNKDYLELLCDDCHALEHPDNKGKKRKLIFDENGMLINGSPHKKNYI